jgi:menaquinone-specific isochorismate synthase
MSPAADSPRLRLTSAPLDDVEDLLPWAPDARAIVWLHRAHGFVGWGEAARIDAGSGQQRFVHAAAALADLTARASVEDHVGARGSGLVAFGSFTFDPRVAGSALLLPQVIVARRENQSWRTVVGDAHVRRPASTPASGLEPHKRDRIRYAGSSMPDLHWLEAVAAAVSSIESGRLEKIVLARDEAVWSRTPFDARLVLRRLSERFPDCYTFLLDGLVGATPELLVRRFGPRIESIVLAGSAARGDAADEDRRLGELLIASAKDRAEHRLAVDSVRGPLEGLCDELTVDREPSLLRLANVQHLATTVRGHLQGTPPPTALELAGLLHPTAAVCGTPTDAALGLIRALEGMDRGRYSGPVGWVDARGDGEWAIALRCAELSGARARLFAGAGIVSGSLPEAELEETRLKLRAMHSALAG